MGYLKGVSKGFFLGFFLGFIYEFLLTFWGLLQELYIKNIPRVQSGDTILRLFKKLNEIAA